MDVEDEVGGQEGNGEPFKQDGDAQDGERDDTEGKGEHPLGHGVYGLHGMCPVCHEGDGACRKPCMHDYIPLVNGQYYRYRYDFISVSITLLPVQCKGLAAAGQDCFPPSIQLLSGYTIAVTV